VFTCFGKGLLNIRTSKGYFQADSRSGFIFHSPHSLPSRIGADVSCFMNSQTEISSFLGRPFVDAFYYHDNTCQRKDEEWLLDEVRALRTNARECSEQGKPEASWGEEVVRPLLNLAIKYWRKGRRTERSVKCFLFSFNKRKN